MEKIMIVDDNTTDLNVTRKTLESEYEVLPASDEKKVVKIIKEKTPNLILLKVDMFDMNGFEVFKKIKELGSPYDEIPVVLIANKIDTDSELEGLNLGAVDYIAKPFSFHELLKRVELHLKLASQ